MNIIQIILEFLATAYFLFKGFFHLLSAEQWEALGTWIGSLSTIIFILFGTKLVKESINAYTEKKQSVTCHYKGVNQHFDIFVKFDKITLLPLPNQIFNCKKCRRNFCLEFVSRTESNYHCGSINGILRDFKTI